MSDDQFTKLFTYMLQGFAEMRHEMHEGFEKNTREHDRIYGVIDATLKRLETLEQEGLY